ncbi:MAG: tRNA epoxyqueuosine(34) reductase QueG [Burkholderiaceae bacterium]|jgi:epoxyqueuosine reductase|nr:tRNA epoxyqueuosine(34) reductase QueG [Burkholderiales bacterium]MCZ8108703.1 tRNA epoxyqueuosine(34) reductase QueG [Burkholderiales bacterium]MCZ8341117.1 tRNA epoxyqueuosine(34) reductase QueG [Burkholderiaceae bacterium]
MELDAGRAWVGRLRAWARELGFASLGVADVDLADAEEGLARWLAAGFHGEMEYMARHGTTRARPAELVPGTVRAVMVAIDYAPSEPDWVERAWATLADGERAYVSRYALGRDYHKVVRARLARLAERLQAEVGPFGWRAFCDSAPVMEVELARRAGLGWRGKHTLLLARDGGSMRFLGTLYTDLPLPVDAPVDEHCGRCSACIGACPTGAIVAPYRLDARRCISYLTIEAKGAIPADLREAIGNRIYGCDDCQLACPWNKYAAAAALPDFAPRERLDAAGLAELFGWDREAFERRFEGSAIRRIGHERWSRNLAVALGNAPTTETVVGALRAREHDPSPLVAEHVRWALARHGQAALSAPTTARTGSPPPSPPSSS